MSKVSKGSWIMLDLAQPIQIPVVVGSILFIFIVVGIGLGLVSYYKKKLKKDQK